jgi:hypothetical protein
MGTLETAKPVGERINLTFRFKRVERLVIALGIRRLPSSLLGRSSQKIGGGHEPPPQAVQPRRFIGYPTRDGTAMKDKGS